MLVHIARKTGGQLLELRKVEDRLFVWFCRGDEIGVKGGSPEVALRLAWREVEGFRPIHCGMRFTLPERDEIGMEAYYWQMAKALEGNGVYFDEELGHPCSVREISQEAKEYCRELSENGGHGASS